MLDFEQCWAALERRDAGEFYYGVRTTGVYCRAGCTSRLPLRKNTLFFETTAAAEAAGLRPCKRCRPTDGTSASRHIAAVERACALLRNSDAIPSLAELADLGVRRVSIGGALARVMWAAVVAAAREFKEGRFDSLAAGMPGTALNNVFRPMGGTNAE